MSLPQLGGSISIEVDTTAWMDEGQNICIRSSSGVGCYVTIDSVQDDTLIGIVTGFVGETIPGHIIPRNSKVTVGVQKTVTAAWIESSIGLGWVKQRSGIWSPVSQSSATITFIVRTADGGRKEVSITGILDRGTGNINIPASSVSGPVNGITVTLRNNNTSAVTIHFEDTASGVRRSWTLFAIDGQGIDGEKGDAGATGPSGSSYIFSGLWSPSTSYTGDSRLRSLIVHNGKFYAAKTNNSNREPLAEESDTFWEYLAADFSGLSLVEGLNGGIRLDEDGEVILSGKFVGQLQVESGSGSHVEMGVIGEDIESPEVTHQSMSFTDSIDIGIWSRQGGRVYARLSDSPVSELGDGDLFNPNLLLHSEDFNQAVWVRDGTLAVNNTSAPEGEADSISKDKSASVSQSVAIASIPFLATGQDITFSAWVRLNEGAEVYLRISELSGSEVKGSSSATVKLIPGQWKRIRVSRKLSESPDRIWVVVGVTSTGEADISIWGAQLEMGLFATPYQRTEADRKGILTVPEATKHLAVQARKFGELSYFSRRTFTHTGQGTAIVAAPYPLPQPRNFSSTLTVTLRTSTTGAHINYTIDGSAPSPSVPAGSAASSVSITLNETTRIRAVAVMSGRTPSGELDVSYFKSVPVVGVTPGGSTVDRLH
jgi:hypothetical protein